jgi:hypothetical protein
LQLSKAVILHVEIEDVKIKNVLWGLVMIIPAR